MKKLYIQPKTDVCEMIPAQIIATSGVIGGGEASDIGWGGNDTDPEAGGDVKENSFEFEW